MATLHSAHRHLTPKARLSPGGGDPFQVIELVPFAADIHFEDPGELRAWSAVLARAADELEAARREAGTKP